jgi:uncharacterized membrane protein
LQSILHWQGGRRTRFSKSMASHDSSSQIGLKAFALAAIALGVVGFAWGDFATNWQRVPPGFPLRAALAYIVAACEFLSGLAFFWRRTAQAGAFFLTVLYSLFSLLWLIQIIASPLVYDNWGNFFEEFSLVAAGAVAFTLLAPPESPWSGRVGLFSRLYALSVISFGVAHFVYFNGAATWVPAWIPLGQKFWVAATGTFFLMAATSILTGVMASLATRLLTIMIALFEILVWIPKLVADPHDHFYWAGNAICIALAAAAWVVSDAITGRGHSYASLKLRVAVEH